MKKIIAVLTIFLTVGFAYSNEEVKLILDEPVDQDINIEVTNPEILETSSQKLENKGVILQNSISPVKGLNYNSNYILRDRKIESTVPMGE